MYGMAGYSHMGVPVDMAHGGHGLGDNSQNGVLDWITGISQAVGTVAGAITGKPPVVYGATPVVSAPKPAQASIFGMPTSTLLLIGGVVVVGTLLMNRKRR